jgi:hypothetical protein
MNFAKVHLFCRRSPLAILLFWVMAQASFAQVPGWTRTGPERLSVQAPRADGKSVAVLTTPAVNSRGQEGVIIRLKLQGFTDKHLAIAANQLPELDPKNFPNVYPKGWFDDLFSKIGDAIKKSLDKIAKSIKKEVSVLVKKLLKIIGDYIGEILVAVVTSQLSDEEKAQSSETGAKSFEQAALSGGNTADKLNLALKRWVDQSSPKAKPVVVSGIHASFVKRAK